MYCKNIYLDLFLKCKLEITNINWRLLKKKTFVGFTCHKFPISGVPSSITGCEFNLLDDKMSLYVNKIKNAFMYVITFILQLHHIYIGPNY